MRRKCQLHKRKRHLRRKFKRIPHRFLYRRVQKVIRNISNPTNTSHPINTNTFTPTVTVNPSISEPTPTPPQGEQGLLTEFTADQPFTTQNSTALTIPTAPQPPLILAQIRLSIDNVNDRVHLNGTVGWGAIQSEPAVEFSITRTRLINGQQDVIFSTRDDAEFVADNRVTTSFTFVDETPIALQGNQLIEYTLQISQISESTNTVVFGPVIFTGAEIEANNS
ncbi:hypothetical protein [Risungbinella massiliensis]|uniref:hypothetical protein n=1 Tax=Risungbinella massiliensis TaxID=1329796 RepID=UPI0005CBD6D7|nr:hypothetical protein [Risungbinella massiliensis]